MASELSFVLILSCIFSGSVAVQNTDGSLRAKILKDYDKLARPYTNVSDEKVVVSIDVVLSRIMELNEHQGVLTAVVWMRVKWTDSRLTWTPASYDNITIIHAAKNEIWTPDLTIFDEANRGPSPDVDYIPLSISNKGNVSWLYPYVVNVPCDVKGKDFPYDQQLCKLIFGSWGYSGKELVLKNYTSKGEVRKTLYSPTWEVKSYTLEYHEVFYSCCPDPYTDVTYYIVLRRRTSNFAISLVMPGLVFMIMTVLGFCLTPASRERIVLSAISLLGMVIFVVIVEAFVLPSSSSLSTIEKFYSGTIGLMLVSLLFYIFTLKIYHCAEHSDCKPPQCLRCFCFNFLAPLLCMCHIFKKKKTSKGCCGGNSFEVTAKTAGDHTEQLEKDEIAMEWRLMALVIDRLFMFMIAIAFLIFAVLILLTKPHHNMR